MSLSLAATQAFLLTHAPSGSNGTGTGHQNGPSGVIEQDLYVQLGAVPRGINDAEIVMLMIPRGAASTLIATYIHVIWFPSRTAAEYLDTADFGAVAVRAVVANPKLHSVTRILKSPADIAKLAVLLDGFSVAPDAMRTCPASFTTYEITFEPLTAGHAAVMATTYGCYAATVTVGGILQPALLDPHNGLEVAVAPMLGISSDHS